MVMNRAIAKTCTSNVWDDCERERNNRTRSNIVLKDKKAISKYKGRNRAREEFITILVDDCLITSKTEIKCDYLLLDERNKVARLIELKGAHYNHGVNQIKNTMKIIGNELKAMGYRKFLGKIACSRSPHIKDSDYKKLKEKIYDECKVHIDIRGNNVYEEELS